MDISIKDIIDKIFNKIKIDIEFDDFLKLLKEKSNNTILHKIKDNKYLFYNNWNYKIKIIDKEQDYITKFFNNIIINTNYNIIMYGGQKIIDSLRDNVSDVNSFIFSSDAKYYESHEGTIINVYYEDDKWNYSTKKVFDMDDSYYQSSKSHGDMFNSIILKEFLEVELNKLYTYHFILIHKDNKNLLNITENKLLLLNARNRNNNFKIIENIKLNNVYSMEEIKLEDWDWRSDKQGIIVYNNELIYRVYNTPYKNKLKMNNNNCKTIQEKIIYRYQNNLLYNDDNKHTITYIINCLSVILMHIYIYWNNGNIINNSLISNEMLRIKKIYPIQYERWDGSRDNFYSMININQIKYHLKQHCNSNYLFKLFNILIVEEYVPDNIYQIQYNDFYKIIIDKNIINNFINLS